MRRELLDGAMMEANDDRLVLEEEDMRRKHSQGSSLLRLTAI